MYRLRPARARKTACIRVAARSRRSSSVSPLPDAPPTPPRDSLRATPARTAALLAEPLAESTEVCRKAGMPALAPAPPGSPSAAAGSTVRTSSALLAPITPLRNH